MVDNNHGWKDDQPRYFGVAAQLTKEMFYGTALDEKSSDQIDNYFIDTPVRQWSARNFLRSNSNADAFIAGLDKIRRRRSVDGAIRSFATSWFKFLGGDLGRLRLEGFLAEIKTRVTHGIIVEEERHLAQQHVRGHIREEAAIASGQPEPVLGKRGREEEPELQEDGITNSPTYKKSAVSLSVKDFLDNGALEDQDEDQDEDPVTLAQERSHHPLNMVFDCQRFPFTCVVDEKNVSKQFTDYYEEAAALPYDHDNFQDFLATGGILFLGAKPTQLQEQCFGEDFQSLRQALISGIEPNKNKEILATQEDDAVTFCQAARNTFRKAERIDRSQARKELKKRIAMEEDSSLKELFEYAAKLPKDEKPVSEADQTSSFVLGMLRPLFDRPDCSRLAHTATTATSGSLFVRLCKHLETAPKHPDLLVRYRNEESTSQERTDIGVAEVSLDPCPQKDIGDLCRIALWSKRIMDEIVTKMEITEEARILFFQVIEKNCTFYAMRRLGTVYAAVKVAEIKIAYTISDVLTEFEKDVPSWLLVDRIFQDLVSTLRSAKPRKSDSPTAPPVFAGLSTPRSRRMSKDTRH
ncbi:hypothetical protein BGX34_003615 [Mortierella sp. NVP85]|nr:hypothetical protein BGX34_003615 [Mortierella sp. NVP85]